MKPLKQRLEEGKIYGCICGHCYKRDLQSVINHIALSKLRRPKEKHELIKEVE